MKQFSFFFKLIASLCLLLVVAAAIWFLIPHPVSKVGRWSIYKEDIQRRAEVERLYGAREAVEEIALKKLEASARHLQILEKHGLTITHDDLVEEDKRIDDSTKSPILLKKIKEVFGKDHESYLKNYVKPGLVDRVIAFEFFPGTPSLQAGTKKTATDLIARAVSGKESLQALAESKTLVTRTISLGEKQKPHAPSKQRDARLKMFDPTEWMRTLWRPSWALGLAKKLKPGEVLDHPIEEQSAWMVVQRLETSSPQNEDYLVIVVPKLRYSEWLTSELESLE